FIFSSRRRHTRSKRDWSSAVCSSDLLPANLLWPPGTLIHPQRSPASLIQTALFAPTVSARVCHGKILFPAHKTPFERKQKRLSRSEERRVGKKCATREEPEQC